MLNITEIGHRIALVFGLGSPQLWNRILTATTQSHFHYTELAQRLVRVRPIPKPRLSNSQRMEATFDQGFESTELALLLSCHEQRRSSSFEIQIAFFRLSLGGSRQFEICTRLVESTEFHGTVTLRGLYYRNALPLSTCPYHYYRVEVGRDSVESSVNQKLQTNPVRSDSNCTGYDQHGYWLDGRQQYTRVDPNSIQLGSVNVLLTDLVGLLV